MNNQLVNINMELIQYPIGRFIPKSDYSPHQMSRLISSMENAPAIYKGLTETLPETDLTRTYREGAWTIRQLVHHVADVQLLNFLRTKKALTEENYVATTMEMNAWAKTADGLTAPIADSLLMLEGITHRFVYLLKSLDEGTFTLQYYHPVRKINLSLKQAIYMAVWHLEHHQAHIELALGRTPHTFSIE